MSVVRKITGTDNVGFKRYPGCVMDGLAFVVVLRSTRRTNSESTRDPKSLEIGKSIPEVIPRVCMHLSAHFFESAELDSDTHAFTELERLSLR